MGFSKVSNENVHWDVLKTLQSVYVNLHVHGLTGNVYHILYNYIYNSHTIVCTRLCIYQRQCMHYINVSVLFCIYIKAAMPLLTGITGIDHTFILYSSELLFNERQSSETSFVE